MALRLPILLLCLGTPFALAAQDFAIDADLVGSCTEDRADLCIPAAAQTCMETHEGGETTVGMGRCLDLAHAAWDARLNESYRDLLAQHRAQDVDLAEIGSSAPELEAPLREMQRAWIAYRDAACTHEAATWGGGTGSGPAYLGCLIELTARQTLRLERYLWEGDREWMTR